MRIKWINTDQPAFFFLFILFNKFYRFWHTPGRLMNLRTYADFLSMKSRILCRRPFGHTCISAPVNLLPVYSLFFQPCLILIHSLGPIIMRMMAPLHRRITVLASLLHSSFRGRQVKFPRQSASISLICQQLRNQNLVFWKTLVPIIERSGTGRISSGKKTCPARSTDRALRICPCKHRSFLRQTVYIRRT